MNPDVMLLHWLNNFVGAVPLIDWLAQLIVNDHLIPTLMGLSGVGLWFAGNVRPGMCCTLNPVAVRPHCSELVWPLI